MTSDEKDAYAPAERQPSTGTAFIVWGAILLLFALLQVVTIPAFLIDDFTSAGLAGKLFAAVAGVGFGVLLLVKGINRRGRYLRR
ncbi:hypothetical protein B7R22_05335 [Subtercola boreus]|uniref:Uncharacterized protein n=1 Tax=Subtercola boreus TaxID=120213 RepID=A0A3E0W1F2_9MICO|nr:hypothetical protein [Subtercola boreus]RFA15831.1 hypothetical protein B7R22_05335 [Subtercola boreus]